MTGRPAGRRAGLGGLGAVLLVVALAGCSSDDGGDAGARKESGTPTPTACTAATATATTQARITASGIDHPCVKVARGAAFTLMNADGAAHDFSTTKTSAAPLRVQLRKGAAFPYKFAKKGTYTLDDASSDLVLTVVVD